MKYYVHHGKVSPPLDQEVYLVSTRQIYSNIHQITVVCKVLILDEATRDILNQVDVTK